MIYVPHNMPTYGRLEKKAVARVFQSHWLSQNVEVRNFENNFANYLGLEEGHVVFVSSGSAALYLAIKVLGISKKVIGFPSYSCSAINNIITLSGNAPKPLDSKENCANLDSKNFLENKELNYLINVSTFGNPSIINEYNRKIIIEDISQALGANYRNKKFGIDNTIGIASISASKIMTSGGQGGILFSKNLDLIKEARDYLNYDNRTDEKIRINFQTTEIQAAFGSSQLKQLNSFIMRRQDLFNRYLDLGIPLFQEKRSDCDSVAYRAILMCKNPRAIIQELANSGIKAIIPYETSELFLKSKECLHARSFAETSLSIPIYPSLSRSNQKYIANKVKRAMKL